MQLVAKKYCNGCSVCYSVCPKNAISMRFDKEGFLYPEINQNCINCGLCT
ncbi:MAG: 4Fe-4S binding protein, partial [Clostridia bacterium]|nr:4Fe-4S binding protein [Clostridia bacterium]